MININSKLSKKSLKSRSLKFKNKRTKKFKVSRKNVRNMKGGEIERNEKTKILFELIKKIGPYDNTNNERSKQNTQILNEIEALSIDQCLQLCYNFIPYIREESQKCKVNPKYNNNIEYISCVSKYNNLFFYLENIITHLGQLGQLKKTKDEIIDKNNSYINVQPNENNPSQGYLIINPENNN